MDLDVQELHLLITMTSLGGRRQVRPKIKLEKEVEKETKQKNLTPDITTNRKIWGKVTGNK